MGLARSIILAAALAAMPAGVSAQPRQSVTPEQMRAADEALARFISPRLIRFADDDEFRRLVEHPERTTSEHEPAEDRDQYDDRPDENQHEDTLDIEE